MAAEEDAYINSRIRCWGCGELGHGKKDCPNSRPSDGKGGASANKGKVIDKGQHTRAEDQGKFAHSPPKCTHPTCGWIGHTEAHMRCSGILNLSSTWCLV